MLFINIISDSFQKIISIIILILSLPILIISSLIIYLEDGFPIVFTQKRIGKNNLLFTIYKLRTMNNEKVTKIGYFLRKYKIDKILQFFNVIKGDMNIIGPRPWTEDCTKYYNLKNNIILNRTPIRPGITGYKQIEHYIVCNEDSDLYYIKNRSFLLNIKIFFLTIIFLIKKILNINNLY